MEPDRNQFLGRFVEDRCSSRVNADSSEALKIVDWVSMLWVWILDLKSTQSFSIWQTANEPLQSIIFIQNHLPYH